MKIIGYVDGIKVRYSRRLNCRIEIFWKKIWPKII